METLTFLYLHSFFLDGLEKLDFSVTFTISFAAGHGSPGFPTPARLVSRPTRKPQIFLHVHNYSFLTDMGTLDFPALAWFSSRPDMETPTFPYLHGFFLDGLENLDFSITFKIYFAAVHGSPGFPTPARLVSRPTRKPQIFLHVHNYSFSTDMGTHDFPTLVWFPVVTKQKKIKFFVLAPVLLHPGLETPNIPHLHGSYHGRKWKPQVSRT